MGQCQGLRRLERRAGRVASALLDEKDLPLIFPLLYLRSLGDTLNPLRRRDRLGNPRHRHSPRPTQIQRSLDSVRGCICRHTSARSSPFLYVNAPAKLPWRRFWWSVIFRMRALVQALHSARISGLSKTSSYTGRRPIHRPCAGYLSTSPIKPNSKAGLARKDHRNANVTNAPIEIPANQD